MDDFELTGYPPPEDQSVIPMVLSTFPPLLKLVWQNRVLNLGMDDSFPDWNEIFHTQVHLEEAWQFGSLEVWKLGAMAQEHKTSDPGKGKRGRFQGIGFP